MQYFIVICEMEEILVETYYSMIILISTADSFLCRCIVPTLNGLIAHFFKDTRIQTLALASFWEIFWVFLLFVCFCKDDVEQMECPEYPCFVQCVQCSALCRSVQSNSSKLLNQNTLREKIYIRIQEFCQLYVLMLTHMEKL